MDNGQTARPLVGILWMLVTGLCFVAVTAIVKYLGPRIPPEEQAFLRYFLGLVFLIPMLPALLNTRLNSKLVLQFGLRGALHAVGVMLWFYAMTRIPLAEVTAINYLAPVYVTLGAALFLGEKLAMRRIAAVITALVGAVIILRPGFRAIEPGHMAMLLAAVVFGGSYLLAKVTVGKVPAAVVVGMLSIVVTLALAPFAYAVWVTPTWTEIGILFGVACFATAGHYTMTLAFAAAPVAVTQPVTFLQLVWATALGALAFSEPVDFWVVLGGAIVLASVSFITWRETMLNRRQITPATPATKV